MCAPQQQQVGGRRARRGAGGESQSQSQSGSDSESEAEELLLSCCFELLGPAQNPSAALILAAQDAQQQVRGV